MAGMSRKEHPPTGREQSSEVQGYQPEQSGRLTQGQESTPWEQGKTGTMVKTIKARNAKEGTGLVDSATVLSNAKDFDGAKPLKLWETARVESCWKRQPQPLKGKTSEAKVEGGTGFKVQWRH